MILEKEVRKILIDKEMSIKELASKCGVTDNAIHSRMKGKGLRPVEEMLEVLGYELKLVKKEEK